LSENKKHNLFFIFLSCLAQPLQRLAEEPIHIQDFRLILFPLKQFINQAIGSKAHTIVLLKFIAANAPHRLNTFLLAHRRQVIANIPMAELIIRPVNVIRRRYNHKEFLFLCHFFHNLGIPHTFMLRKDPDAHQ